MDTLSPGKENSLQPTTKMDSAVDKNDDVVMKDSSVPVKEPQPPAAREAPGSAVKDPSSANGTAGTQDVVMETTVASPASVGTTPHKTPKKHKRSGISTVRAFLAYPYRQPSF
jgi:hypothetical protein